MTWLLQSTMLKRWWLTRLKGHGSTRLCQSLGHDLGFAGQCARVRPLQTVGLMAEKSERKGAVSQSHGEAAPTKNAS